MAGHVRKGVRSGCRLADLDSFFRLSLESSVPNFVWKLWRDDSGFVVSTELVLTTTLLVLGITVGQTTLRDAVIIELADLADAISQTNHSYSFSTVTGHSSSVAGTSFEDGFDFCDGEFGSGGQGLDSGFGSEGQCVNLSVAVSGGG